MQTLHNRPQKYNIWYKAKSKGKIIDILIGKRNENGHDHIVLDDWKLVCNRYDVRDRLSKEELKRVNWILKVIFYNFSFNS